MVECRCFSVQVRVRPGESVSRCVCVCSGVCSAVVFFTRSLKLLSLCVSASASSSSGDKSRILRISFGCVRRSTLIY